MLSAYNKSGTDSQMHVLIYTWNIKQIYKTKKCRHVCKGLETGKNGQSGTKGTKVN